MNFYFFLTKTLCFIHAVFGISGLFQIRIHSTRLVQKKNNLKFCFYMILNHSTKSFAVYILIFSFHRLGLYLIRSDSISRI